jgi:DEAD/DEAH box helicase domain-containing protein
MAPIDSVLERFYNDPSTNTNFTAARTIPASKGVFAPFPQDIHPSIVRGLIHQGISSLYVHQKLAWEYAQNGDNFVVTTGTASGKTLCYNLPVINQLIIEPESRALYIFPTKALAHDQLTNITSLIESCGLGQGSIAPATYDGDTPHRIRTVIRNDSRLILSNPDMLHTGILPRHPQWSSFFEHLLFVVIDEIHTYRGVFGSHVANVIRRLKRIADYYGTSPQFVLTSATIGNPKQLSESLIASPVQTIDIDGSQRGEKHFLIYNPPIIDRELGLRASLIQECVNLSRIAFDNHVQTIIFGRSRRSVEVILSNIRAFISSTSSGILTQIRAYRSGYLPKKRREIEKGLRNGDVKIVVATTA